MAASKLFRLTRLQGALLGSFFLHALLLYGLTRSSGSVEQSSAEKNVVMQVQLLPVIPSVEAAPELPKDTEPLPVATDPPTQQQSPVVEASPTPAPSEKGLQALPWKPAEPKVKTFPEIAYPPDTVNITATLEIEVSIDNQGKATEVKVLRESPKAMFTEWAWEMGMKGSYSPKITANGPVPSTLTIRMEITPGMPIDVH